MSSGRGAPPPPPPPGAKAPPAQPADQEETASVDLTPLSPAEKKAAEKRAAEEKKKADLAAKEQAKRDAEERKRQEKLAKANKKSGNVADLAVLPMEDSAPVAQAPPPPPPKQAEVIPGPPPGKKSADPRAAPPSQQQQQSKPPASTGSKPMAPGAPAPMPEEEMAKQAEASKPAIPDGQVPPPPPGPAPKRRKKEAVALRAKHNYTAANGDELSLRKGDKLFGFELMENNAWWYGELVGKDKQRGMFPCNFVEAVDPKVKRDLATMLAASADPALRSNNNNARPAPSGGGRKKDASKLKLTLYAHNLGYAGASFSLIFGALSALWWYQSNLLLDTPLKQSSLWTYIWVWTYALVVGACVWIFEYSYGLVRTRSEMAVISPRGWAYLTISAPMWFGYPTMICGGILGACGIVNMLADWNREEGDASDVKGTYSIMWFESRTAEEKREDQLAEESEKLSQTWLKRARERGTLSQHIIVFLYLFINFIIAGVTLYQWETAVNTAFINNCSPQQCPSYWAPWAKTFGVPLNFNCALVLVPVLRSLLRWANNYQISPTTSLATYLPLRKNIIFHKLIASMIAILTAGHTLAHYVNFAFVPEFTLMAFGPRAWGTGTAILFSMVIIYSGAQNRVKRANYEIFFVSHHFFIVFFVMLLAHGQNFWAWSCIPVLLYVGERVYRSRRGNTAFFVRRVLYIPPVMEVCFFPEHDSDFVFREGQYLYLLCPHLSDNEWHPFTISSAHGDLEQEKEVTCHIRVQGEKSWTRELMEYFALMTHSKMKVKDAFLLELEHYDSNGERQIGKYLGPDGLPILSVDGPHAAPAQHYSEYKEVMIVGAGIGLTPSSAILKSVCRHKWKKGWLPQTIYFYWVVRHEEIESFRWFIKVMVELEKRVASDRYSGALGMDKYIEMNVYVTAAPKKGGPFAPAKLDFGHIASATSLNVGFDVDIGFDEDRLMRTMLNPTMPSDKQREIQGTLQGATGRLMDIWVWNGRPNWADIFLSVKQQRESDVRKIGCCFCGTPVIGKDLKKFCIENSSLNEGIAFDLHKENF